MRTLLQGGKVFDGSGADPAPADVVVEDGRIVEVGPGLDGDESVDCTGRTVLPGFIDSHVHFMLDGDLDRMAAASTPFSLNFYLAAERMGVKPEDCLVFEDGRSGMEAAKAATGEAVHVLKKS